MHQATPRALLRLSLFVLALGLMTVDIRWDSQNSLPWPVRAAGIAGILAALAWPGWERFLRSTRGWVATAERHPHVVVGALAVAAFLMAVFLAQVVYGPYPHIPDGVAYYFQAKVFASGRLFAPSPPLADAFGFDWIAVHDGRWFGIFPPGWPLLLAAGVKLGAPAFVNPVLGACCVLVVYRLGKALFGVRNGLLCALFCCLSPFFLFMSAEFMSHTAALVFTALSTLYYVKAREARAGIGSFAASGAAAGVAFLIRPLDALAIWAAQTVHGLWTIRSRRMAGGSAVSLAMLACGVGLYVVYNRILVGTWFSAPLLLVSPRNRLGFGPDIGYPIAFPTPGHDPWRSFLNLNHNAAVMSQDLFGWPISSLCFVLLLGLFGRTDTRHRLCGIIIAAVVAAYALFWYHGEAFGARFYFTLLPALLMLTIEGIRQTPEILAGLIPRAALLAPRLTVAMVTLCFVFGWMVYVPKISFVSPYFNYKGVNSGFDDFRRRERLDNAVVFVQAPAPLYYGPALLANEIPVELGRVIYARDLGDARNAQLAAAFPGRSVHRYTYAQQPNPVRAWLEGLLRDTGLSGQR